jgi:hypothetical protein
VRTHPRIALQIEKKGPQARSDVGVEILQRAKRWKLQDRICALCARRRGWPPMESHIDAFRIG